MAVETGIQNMLHDFTPIIRTIGLIKKSIFIYKKILIFCIGKPCCT